MATKSGQQEPEKAEVVEELLDALDTALDRVKVLYEQYFLGIQKQPPTYLHTDVERKIRDITQLQVRNTALRYRFATLQQKFGSYNAYWRRTLRQIENGTYTRNLSKVGRQAARTGAAVPEEILAAMPKRMREQVQRDREAALALDRLRAAPVSDDDDQELLTLADEDAGAGVDLDGLEPAAFVRESTDVRNVLTTNGGAHKVDEADADFDLDAFFARVVNEDAPTPVPDLPVVRVRNPTPRTEPRPRRATSRTTQPRPSPELASRSAPLAPSRPPTEPSSPPVQGPPSGTPAVGPLGAAVARPAVTQPLPRAPTPVPQLPASAATPEMSRISDDDEPTPIFLPAMRPASAATPASGAPRVATSPGSLTPAAGGMAPRDSARAIAPSATIPSAPVARDSARAIGPSAAIPSAPVSSAATPAGVAHVARDSARAIGPSAAIPSAPVSSATPPVGMAHVARDSSRAIGPIAASAAIPSAPVSSATPPAGMAHVARDSSRAIGPSAVIPSAPVSSPPAAGVMPRVAKEASPTAGRPPLSAAEPVRPPPLPAAALGGSRVAKDSSPTAGRPPLPAAEPVRPPPVKPVIPVMPAPSQATRPSPIAPGASAARAPVAVETLAGPFPRIPSIPTVPPVPPPVPPPPRPRADAAPARVEQGDATERTPAASSPPPPASGPATSTGAPPASGPATSTAAPPVPPAARRRPPPRQPPPPGMTDADVSALYTKYVEAKERLGEDAGPHAYGKLLKTIHAQAPKIMEQYNARGVDFSVVVKDNQIVIRAKPKP